MKVKTSELSGAALDWAVWATQKEPKTIQPRKGFTLNIPKFSSDWSKCGPLIDKYKVAVDWNTCNIDPKYDNEPWMALITTAEYGATPQIAICRAVVSSVLGDEIDVPEGLQ